MIDEIIKFAALGTSGIASFFLASGVSPTNSAGTSDNAATTAYWISERFGFLGLTLFAGAVFAWMVFPKAVDKLFSHLEKLESRNEMSRQDFLNELREERKHRETALDGFKAHLEIHTRTNADVIRNQTETLVRELKR
jgi:hypothetical protein